MKTMERQVGDMRALSPLGKIEKPWRLLVALFVPSALAIWSLISLRGTIAYSDDFEMIVESKSILHGVFDVEISWFVPIMKLSYGIIANVWGFESYFPLRFMGVVLVWMSGVGLAFKYKNNSVILMVVVPLWFGTLAGAFHTLLWPAASWTLIGVTALFVIDHAPAPNSNRINRFDFLALGLTSIILLSSGPMGVPFVVAIAIIRFRNFWQLSSLFALVPILIYAFIVKLFEDNNGEIQETPIWVNLKGAGTYIGQALLGSANTFIGFSEFGPIAIVSIAILYFYCLPGFSPKQRRFHIAWVGGTLCYWVLLAISRGQLGEPAAPRYTIVGALTLLILMSDCLVVIFSKRQLKSLIYPFGIVTCLVISSNWSTLELRTNDFQYLSGVHRAKFTALEIVESNIPDDFSFDPVNLPQFDWETYRTAIQSKGTPAYSLNELRKRPLWELQIADEILLKYSLFNQISRDTYSENCSSDTKRISWTSVVLRNYSNLDQSAGIRGFGSTELWTLLVPANSTIEYAWNGSTKYGTPLAIDLNGLSLCF